MSVTEKLASELEEQNKQLDELRENVRCSWLILSDIISNNQHPINSGVTITPISTEIESE